jgi:high-affinity Fe2+/Pb2+ permease
MDISFTDFYISLALTFVLTIVIYKWFGDIGLGSYPILTMLFITVVSYVLTYAAHLLIVHL